MAGATCSRASRLREIGGLLEAGLAAGRVGGGGLMQAAGGGDPSQQF